MKIVGIIADYNPLHNGHVYHFNEIKNKSKADYIIAIISSSFAMRGDISVFNKFDKTALALKMGVDIVVELPFVFAVSNANIFSYYSVLFLSMLKVNEIWIGSELKNEKIYSDYYNVLITDEYDKKLKDELSRGISYKAATQNVFNSFNLPPLLSNDKLGVFYYKAIQEINKDIKLISIKRHDYTEDYESSVSYTSASKIREDNISIKNLVPSYTYELYEKKGFLKIDKLFQYLKFQVINNPTTESFENEGFINKFREIYKYDNFYDFYNSLKSKRYTNNFINRIILFVLFNISKEDINLSRSNISYVRVLGFNSNGRKYLNSIKDEVEVVTNIKNNIHPSLDIEIKISKILDLIYNEDLFKQEQKGPIIEK